MQSSQDIETTFRPAERNPVLCVREIRSIDWLSRSNENSDKDWPTRAL